MERDTIRAPVPRTRGDGPSDRSCRATATALFPAHAGMDRGVCGQWCCWWCCSPHTRGWTGKGGERHGTILLFPAHAGMDRTSGHQSGGGARLFPAHAGMDRPTWQRRRQQSPCSPHTRGWTVKGRFFVQEVFGLFPAHAGMDRGKLFQPLEGVRCSPHTRGWTALPLVRWCFLTHCSPHTRGWTAMGCL